MGAEPIITGITRGGTPWVPQFVTALDESKCIGCGRCFKVCPRDVLTIVQRAIDDVDLEMTTMTTMTTMTAIIPL